MKKSGMFKSEKRKKEMKRQKKQEEKRLKRSKKGIPGMQAGETPSASGDESPVPAE